MPTASSPELHTLVSNYDFRPADAERLAAALPGAQLVLVRGSRGLREALVAHPEVDVLCTFFPPEDLLDIAPHLRWLALPSAGADHVLRLGITGKPNSPLITTANGIHAVPISEFVLTLMLLWTRNWPIVFDWQREHIWPTRDQRQQLRGYELHDASLGIIGLGAIGRQIARSARAFGMRVLATRRTMSATPDPDVDLQVPLSDLAQLLSAADFVVLAVPSTRETYHLIAAEQLRQMKRSAFLVNIARGNVIDEQALIAALQSGEIAGAGLDVFEEEPLPPDSPLWTMPNVIVTPHISGATQRYSERFTDLFLRNIERYRAGQPLINLVDPERGY